MRRRTTKTLAQLHASMREDQLGDKATPTKPGEVQCPFCSTVYRAFKPEHSISGICDACFPAEKPEPHPDTGQDDEEAIPF